MDKLIGYITIYFKVVGNDNDVAYCKIHHDFGVFPDMGYLNTMKLRLEEAYTELGMHVIYVETCSKEDYEKYSGETIVLAHNWKE